MTFDPNRRTIREHRQETFTTGLVVGSAAGISLTLIVVWIWTLVT